MTRVHNKYVESIWEDLSGEPRPDVVIMNSCLWDVSRYGPTSMSKYKTNLEKTFREATESIPPECLFIWNTALPVANKIRGGFLLPELDFLCSTLRLDVLEGNFYAKELAGIYGLDVLDLHYFFRYQLHRRAPDGVHWNHQAHRRITNLILTHVANAWGLDPPRHVDELSRGLPPADEERQVVKAPSPLPDALGFIDFDKPAPGSSTKPKQRSKSIPAALGRMPEEESKTLASSATSSNSSSSINLVGKPSASADDKSQQKKLEQSRPKSADGHLMSSGSLAKSDQNHPISLDDFLNSTRTKPSSTEGRPSSADGRHNSTGKLSNSSSESRPSRPSSAESRPITQTSNQPGLLGSPPKHMPITSVAPRQRQKTRWAPYTHKSKNNNVNKPPPVPVGECYNGPANLNNFSAFQNINLNQVVDVSVPPPNFNMGFQGPPFGYPQPHMQGQVQADMEWRRQQRMNRMMHERGMEFNWFGFNWG